MRFIIAAADIGKSDQLSCLSVSRRTERKDALYIFVVGYASIVVGIIKNRLQMANDRFSLFLHD